MRVVQIEVRVVRARCGGDGWGDDSEATSYTHTHKKAHTPTPA